MRGLRSTIGLLVVLIGLGAYIYFVTSKKPDIPVTKQDKVFASLEAAKIDELKIKSATGDVTTVKKENGTWKIVEPMAMPASDSDATALANTLSELEVVRVVEESPTDVKP